MNVEQMFERAATQRHGLRIDASWGQGRASFGGLVAALAYEAMAASVPADRPLRSLALTFVGPVAPDEELSVAVEVLREGRAVSQIMARVVQADQVVTLLQASFGSSRHSVLNLGGASAPTLPALELCQSMPQIAGITPAFTQHIDMRWGIGGLPFSDTASRLMGGWVRFAEQQQPQQLTTAHLIALVDAWPPAVLPYLSQPAPGSSLTWTLEFVQGTPHIAGDQWCQYLAEVEYAGEGYGHVAAKLWGPGGQLIAISRQTVAVFA